MAGVRLDSDIMSRVGWEYVPKDALKLNVLMFGFDSLSRMTFMRQLPKSYDKLMSLDAIVLEGYNVLGDGTPQALIPLLTGMCNTASPFEICGSSGVEFYATCNFDRKNRIGNARYEKTYGIESHPCKRVPFHLERFSKIWLCDWLV